MNRKPDKDWWPTPIVGDGTVVPVLQSKEWWCTNCHLRINVKAPEDGSKAKPPVGWSLHKVGGWHCPNCVTQRSNVQLRHQLYKDIDTRQLVDDALARYYREIEPQLQDHQKMSFALGDNSRLLLDIIAIMIEEAFKQ